MLKSQHEFDKSAPLAHNRSPFADNSDSVKNAKNSKLFAKNSKLSAKSSGFTIIEVALVLAIAGLIFLVVFLALPALQSAQRDNALKQDAAHVATAIEQFYADGGNAADVPSSTTATFSGPVPNPQLDPYLKNLNLAGVSNLWIYGNSDPRGRFSAPTVGRHTIDVYFGDKCWTADSPTGWRYPGDKQFVPGSPQDAAVVTRFDNYVAYCIDVGR